VVLLSFVGGVLLLCSAGHAYAQERLCDPAFEDCRTPLIDLIRAETVGIDAAFWFMEDFRYAQELISKFQQGVRVRVLVDSRANVEHPLNGQILAQLTAAGIPIRRRTASGILHWKMMLFAGQGWVEFSGANYSPHAFRPDVPFTNYTDEAIFFTSDPAIVRTFMRRFDDLWTDTAAFAHHANITGTPPRQYPLHAVHPDMNFPPGQSFRSRSVARYRAETSGIDVTMYRITDRAHTDAMIAAVARGVPVRLITAPEQYRDPSRLWHSWNVDRLYMAGVQIRHSAHLGLNHQKSVQLRAQGMTIFGSSNWTSPSSSSQEEHNYFTTKPWIMQWFTDQFERKWNNLVALETQPFVPLPPDRPVYASPINVGTDAAPRLALAFDGGPFAHLYDIYFGTAPDPPLLEANVPLGPRQPGRALLRYELPPLAPNTTYYWRVVSRTMALQEAPGIGVASFTTAPTRRVAPITIPGPTNRALLASDVDGDGKGDLVWRQIENGALSVWLMDGVRVAATPLVETGRSLDFRIAGSGDLNGDGRGDLVWRHTRTGDVWARLTTSAVAGQHVLIASGIAAAAVAVWLIEGGTQMRGLFVSQSVPLVWQIAAVGDLDGDGSADLVWRHSQTGDVAAWLLNGGSVKFATVVLPAVSRVWQIAGIGDLDRDGKADLIWRHQETGGVAAWLMNGTVLKRSAISMPGVPLVWQIAAFSDFDGDGQVDLAWRNTANGDVAVWLMDGTGVRQTAIAFAGVPRGWQIR
jgi:hypothetical protein